MPIMYSRLCRRVVAGSFPVARRVAASDGMASMAGEDGGGDRVVCIKRRPASRMC